jgi:hypothetical protein
LDSTDPSGQKIPSIQLPFGGGGFPIIDGNTASFGSTWGSISTGGYWTTVSGTINDDPTTFDMYVSTTLLNFSTYLNGNNNTFQIAANKAPSKKACTKPNPLQAAEANALRKVASFTGKTVGFGVAAGGGFGLVGIGVSASGSAQIMADPSGAAALVYSWTLPSAGYMSTSPGQGENMGGAANIGIQFSVSSQNISSSPSWSLDGSYANFGGSANSSGGSITVGYGVGARVSGNLNVNLPTVVALCP